MNKKNKNWKLKQLLLDLLFFLVLLALDQGTKYLAVTHLKDRSSVKIWPGVFVMKVYLPLPLSVNLSLLPLASLTVSLSNS